MSGENKNKEFDLRGVSHLALVCSDMQKTVDFYQGILGMPFIMGHDMPGGIGQHFFFDMGNGDSLAFMWFPHMSEHAPGIASPQPGGEQGDEIDAFCAPGSMNHLAFEVPLEKMDEYHMRLREKGVAVSDMLNHDDSEFEVSPEVNERTWIRSIYFWDPDGMLLEFAAWTDNKPGQVAPPAATAADRPRYLQKMARTRAGETPVPDYPHSPKGLKIHL